MLVTHRLPRRALSLAGHAETVQAGAPTLGHPVNVGFKVARSALSYASRKAVKDAPVIKRMRSLSRKYPRYGYRRIRA
jgi:hypothetical protein